MYGKEKRNRLLSLILTTWRRIRLAMPRTRSLTMMPLINLRRFWHDSDMVPEGYFAVYVGPGRTRFVMKTELVNHPLFRVLLEEAEMEYRFVCAGPLTLPCEVAVFRRILEALNKDCGGESSLKLDDVRLELLSGGTVDICN